MSEESDPPCDDDPIVAAARRAFPQFYRLSSPEEEALMDGLALARASLMENVAVPRSALTPLLRGEVEKMTNAVEGLFTVLREAVRRSAAFHRVDDHVQAQIEREMLELPLPPTPG